MEADCHMALEGQGTRSNPELSVGIAMSGVGLVHLVYNALRDLPV